MLSRSPAAPPGGDRDRFHDPATRPELARAIVGLVDTHGPLPREEAWRVLAEAWGFGRLGRRIRATLDAALDSLPDPERPTARGEVLWPVGLDPVAWRGFRYQDGADRDVGQVPAEEAANAAAWVLERGISMSREALRRETARILGAAQLGRRVRQAIEAGVEHLIDRGDATAEEDGRVVWRGRSG